MPTQPPSPHFSNSTHLRTHSGSRSLPATPTATRPIDINTRSTGRHRPPSLAFSPAYWRTLRHGLETHSAPGSPLKGILRTPSPARGSYSPSRLRPLPIPSSPRSFGSPRKEVRWPEDGNLEAPPSGTSPRWGPSDYDDYMESPKYQSPIGSSRASPASSAPSTPRSVPPSPGSTMKLQVEPEKLEEVLDTVSQVEALFRAEARDAADRLSSPSYESEMDYRARRHAHYQHAKLHNPRRISPPAAKQLKEFIQYLGAQLDVAEAAERANYPQASGSSKRPRFAPDITGITTEFNVRIKILRVLRDVQYICDSEGWVDASTWELVRGLVEGMCEKDLRSKARKRAREVAEDVMEITCRERQVMLNHGEHSEF